jgi:hypothetical protein
VQIRNLSFYGFRADGSLPLKHGDYVSVDLPNLGLVRARIAWCKEDRFGAVFPTAMMLWLIIFKRRTRCDSFRRGNRDVGLAIRKRLGQRRSKRLSESPGLPGLFLWCQPAFPLTRRCADASVLTGPGSSGSRHCFVGN